MCTSSLAWLSNLDSKCTWLLGGLLHGRHNCWSAAVPGAAGCFEAAALARMGSGPPSAGSCSRHDPSSTGRLHHWAWATRGSQVVPVSADWCLSCRTAVLLIPDAYSGQLPDNLHPELRPLRSERLSYFSFHVLSCKRETWGTEGCKLGGLALPFIDTTHAMCAAVAAWQIQGGESCSFRPLDVC